MLCALYNVIVAFIVDNRYEFFLHGSFTAIVVIIIVVVIIVVVVVFALATLLVDLWMVYGKEIFYM